MTPRSEERVVRALESIARSLETIANPPIAVAQRIVGFSADICDTCKGTLGSHMPGGLHYQCVFKEAL